MVPLAEIKKQPARKELSHYILEFESALLKLPKKGEEKSPVRDVPAPTPILS